MPTLITIVVGAMFIALIVAMQIFINRSRKLAEHLSKARDAIQRQQRTLTSVVGKMLMMDKARKTVEASRDDIATVAVLLADRAAEVLRIDETDATAAKWRLLRPIRSVIPILAGGDFSQIRAEVLKNAREQESRDNVDFIKQIANRDSQRVIRQWRERAGRVCTCKYSGKGGDVADIDCPQHGLKVDAIRRELAAMTTNDDSQPVRCTQCGLTEAEDPHEHGFRDHAFRYPNEPEPFMDGVQSYREEIPRPDTLWCSYCGKATDHATRDCGLRQTCSVCRQPFSDKCRAGKCDPATKAIRDVLERAVTTEDTPLNTDPPDISAPVRERYSELILAVESKWPGETRHQTALRYIRQAENGWRNLRYLGADKEPADADDAQGMIQRLIEQADTLRAKLVGMGTCGILPDRWPTPETKPLGSDEMIEIVSKFFMLVTTALTLAETWIEDVVTTAICAYCRSEIPKDLEMMAQHAIHDCPNHPLHRMQRMMNDLNGVSVLWEHNGGGYSVLMRDERRGSGSDACMALADALGSQEKPHYNGCSPESD